VWRDERVRARDSCGETRVRSWRQRTRVHRRRLGSQLCKWQFSIDRRMLAASRDAFELVTPLRYLVGKVTSEGVSCCARWSPQLEMLIQGIDIAAKAVVAAPLPTHRWWAEDQEPGKALW
jgi:hypothetical protein